MLNIVSAFVLIILTLASLAYLYRQTRIGMASKRRFWVLFVVCLPALILAMPWAVFTTTNMRDSALFVYVARLLFELFPPFLALAIPFLLFQIVMCGPTVIALGWAGSVLEKKLKAKRTH